MPEPCIVTENPDNGPDESEDTQDTEEPVKALPEDIRSIAENWKIIVGKLNSKDKLASTMLQDAIANEENGKLKIFLKNELDVITMNFKAEAGGELQPSRLDLLHDEIARLTGKDVEITAALNDGSPSVRKKDITKLVKFTIRDT